jgi:LacI family transcriptional regulator
MLESGMRIPRDIALVGFDNIEQGEYAAVPLTTIQQPTDRIGSEAVDVLIRKIEHREAQTRTVFLPSLVIRESCGFRAATVRVPNRTTTVNDTQAQLTTEEK